MTGLSINVRWLNGDLDQSEETVTFAEIAVLVASALVTKTYDPVQKEISEGARLPAVVLAAGVAENWWSLLYEPQKRQGDRLFEARHRLDALTRGYAFPPLGIWSGGDTVMAGLFRPDTRFQQQQFLLPDQRDSWALARNEVETALRAFIAETISRLGSPDKNVHETWRRICASEQDPAEREWCVNAGRLGLDPYDPDTPDLERIKGTLSEELFADLCEAAEPDELSPVANWVRDASRRLRYAPTIMTRGFGAAPRPDFGRRPYTEGYAAARLLRTRMSLTETPQWAPDTLLGNAATSDRATLLNGAPLVEGLARRENNEIRLAVAAVSHRQRRFRLCRSIYLAWRSSGSTVAATTASTWRQQASRALAAELLAPADLLRDRAGNAGLTEGDIDVLANELGCPATAIIRQAQNHNVALRDVRLPV